MFAKAKALVSTSAVKVSQLATLGAAAAMAKLPAVALPDDGYDATEYSTAATTAIFENVTPWIATGVVLIALTVGILWMKRLTKQS